MQKFVVFSKKLKTNARRAATKTATSALILLSFRHLTLLASALPNENITRSQNAQKTDEARRISPRNVFIFEKDLSLKKMFGGN